MRLWPVLACATAAVLLVMPLFVLSNHHVTLQTAASCFAIKEVPSRRPAIP